MTSTGEDKWYVAQLKPNEFERAKYNIRKQGFETFMPLRRKSVRHARKTNNVLRPVFPGYIFTRFGADRGDWRKINSTFGVSKLISFEAGKPSPVPNALIEGLRARCDCNDILQPLDDFKTGEKVRVISGNFAEFVGEIETFVTGDRLRLLFDFMSQVTRVDVPRGDVDRI